MLDVLNRSARIANGFLRTVSLALALIMLVFAGYSVLDSYYLERSAFSSWDLVQYRPVDGEGEVQENSFEELRSINPDVVGWITIYGTNIDYPILQGPDDMYYVNRNLYGECTLSGSIYLQAENSSDFSDSFNLLYGHHFDNGAMFGDVANYTDPDFFNSHRSGELITPDGVYYLDIFACMETDAYDSTIYGVTSIDDGREERLMPSPRKLVYFPAPPVKAVTFAPNGTVDTSDVDNILALSTCDDAETDGRVVVVAEVQPGTTSRVDRTQTTGTQEQQGVARTPATGETRTEKWAFLNLACLVFTVFCIVPFFIRFISGRKDKVRSREVIGAFLALTASVSSVLLFFITENMRNPVTLRDDMTPFMMFIFAGALLVTALCDRIREEQDAEGQEASR